MGKEPTSDKIGKAVIMRNAIQYTADIGMLTYVLDKAGKAEFTDSEVRELLEKESKRKVDN